MVVCVVRLITVFPTLFIFISLIKKNLVDELAILPTLIFKPVWSNYVEIWRTAGCTKAFHINVILAITQA